MKTLKLTAIAIIALFAVVGCGRESLTLEERQSATISEKGLLALGGLVAECRVDERNKDNDVLPEETTRASEGVVDVNTFDCQIINSDNEVVMSFKLGERPTEAIELKTGDYIFKVQSGEIPDAAWETPVYGGEKAFKIVRDTTTSIEKIICSLLNIKVSLDYAPDLFERLGAETVATVSVEGHSLSFALTEQRAAFYVAPRAKNTITIAIEAQYAADKVNYKKVNMTKYIENVSAGQYSKIHLYLANADKGKLDVSVQLHDWVTDEVIPCSVADLIFEDEYIENPDQPSGDNPSIVWDGYDISKRYSLDDVTAVDLLINAKHGISQFLVQIKSETLTPEELAGVGICDVLNLCYPAQSYDSNNPGVYIDTEGPLRGLGFAVGDEVLGKEFVKLSITQFLGVLKSVSQDGHRHDFVITVTDSEGNQTIRTLKLQSGEVTEEPAAAPTIAWVGHDIAQREQIVDGLEVDLLVEAEAGISQFLVQIKSETLTPSELSGVGICDVLNLCYPAQSYDSNNPGVYIDTEDPLRGLGFTVGEDVIGKTSVTLSITQFMGVLKAVSGEELKLHDFVLTVTDSNGNTTVKTLMLQTGK